MERLGGPPHICPPPQPLTIEFSEFSESVELSGRTQKKLLVPSCVQGLRSGYGKRVARPQGP